MNSNFDKIITLIKDVSNIDFEITEERNIANSKLNKINSKHLNDISHKNNKLSSMELSLKKVNELKNLIKNNKKRANLEFLYSFIIVSLILYLIFKWKYLN